MSTQYKVQSSDAQTGPWSDETAYGAGLTAHLTGVTTNVGIWYRIAKSIDGIEQFSDPLLILVADVPTLSADGTSVGDIKISISWIQPCSSTFRIYKQVGENPPAYLTTVSGVNDYDDFSVSPGVQYKYYVTAVTSDGYETDPSNVVTVTIPLTGVLSMSSRATINQTIQMGAESTAGTAVAATKRILGLSELVLKPTIPAKPVRSQGRKGYTGVQVGQQHSEFTYNGVIDFNMIPVIFDSMFGVATPAAHGTAYDRSYAPESDLPLTPKSYTIEVGSSNGAEKCAFGIFRGITFKWNKEEASIEGNGFGNELLRGITMTALDYTDDLVSRPVHPASVGIYISTDGSAFTLLNDSISGELRMGGLWEPSFHVSDVEPSFDRVKEMFPSFGVTLDMEEGSEVDDFITDLLAATKIWIRFKAIGSLLDATPNPDVYETVQVTMPVYVVSPDPGDKDGVYGNTIVLECADNVDGLVEILVTNNIATNF